ncbi:MAG: NusG domain II-containing protein [Clostridia bacterium]
MKKLDIVIIATVILLSVALYLGLRPHGGEYAVIYVGNSEYARIPLDEPQTIVIKQGECINEIEVFSGGVRMKYSTCKNQLCIKQGILTTDSDLDSHGSIVCLPNGVSILIDGGAK